MGPCATAFHRLFWALPFLVAWRAWDGNLTPRPPAPGPAPPPVLLLLPGLCFAGDLALWHWSIRLTSVANATLLANVAPIFVTAAAWVLFRERITPVFLAGMALAFTGAAVVVGANVGTQSDRWKGDLFGLATALFYAGYMLSAKYVRNWYSTRRVLAWSSVAACPVLVVLAVLAKEDFWPHSAKGWLVIGALALVSQIGGQGLIIWALAHLPASFSSVSLLVQPAAAAVLARGLLGERLTPLQAAAGLITLAGIALAGHGSLTQPPRSRQRTDHG